MRILLFLALSALICCSQPAEHQSDTNNFATLECLLDAYLAEFPPADEELLWVHEGTGWTDTTSIVLVSTYNPDFLDQELAEGKQAATYRGRQVIYVAEQIGAPEARVADEELLPTTIVWSPVDTSGLPARVMVPPHNPPVTQVIYNHENRLFEDILLVTSSMEAPGCN